MDVENLENFINTIRKALENPPGIEAYEKMMPEIRDRLEHLDVSKIDDAKLSSVLILLYQYEEKIYIPLTKRHDYKGTHGGQISFPGGKHEEDDESRTHTALREAHEEIGVDPSEIEIIGLLSEIYISPSNFKVLPVVGYINVKPSFVREEFEVEKIIEVEISDFLDKANHKIKDMEVRNSLIKDIPYFDIQGHVVWGATAMILSELVYIIENMD
ncbi:MAG: CoA pyrophosphatase [Cyclobacteriaceae bacterium]|nr:CoA pyrophosphatase [Cyclobacteriaceae bacterium]